MRLRFELCLVFVLVVCVGGCSQQSPPGTCGNCGSPDPISSGGAICPALAASGPRFVEPSPGATAVSTAPARIVFVDRPPTASVAVRFVADHGATIAVGTLTRPSPLPSGPPPEPSLPYPQLASATTYTVTFEDTSTTTCPLAIGSSGFFATQ